MKKISRFSLMFVCFLMVLILAMGLVACNENPDEQVVRQLTIETSEHGRVEAEKSAYADGETVTLTITKSAGYYLTSIKLNDEEKLAQVSADGKTLSFVINEDTTVKAVFSKIPTYAINIQATGGTVVANKSVYNGGDTAKLTLTPNSYYEITTFTVNGDDKKTAIQTVDGKQEYEFVINQNATVVAVFTKMANVNAQVSVASRYNLNGMTLTLTPAEGASKTATVADGSFTIEDASLGTEYLVSGTSGNMTIKLGKVIVTGEQIAYDPAITDNSSTSLNVASGSYVVEPDYHKGIDLTFAEPATGDAWFVTKMQIDPADMAALLAGTGEIVAGISLKANDTQTSVEHMIQLKPGDSVASVVCGCDADKGGSGVWNYDGNNKHLFFDAEKELTAQGSALAGDGLYFIVKYDNATGMTYTYWGVDIYNIVVMRDWGTGAGHAFTPGTAIAGISLGYVHTTWGTNPPCDITYSSVGYGATLAEALGNIEVTLDADNTFENGSVEVEGYLYGDVTITFIPDTDYGVGAVTVNGQQMTPDADGIITLENYKEATVDVTAVFQGGRFAVTTDVTDANITLEITDKEGNVLAPADLQNVLYGTVLTVTAKPAEGYIVKEDSFTIGGQTVFGTKHNFTVTDATTLSVEAEAAATIEGTLSAMHYSEYISSIEVYVTVQGGTDKYIGKLTPAQTGDVHDWSITIPADYTNFAIVLHDSEGRFVDITIECADTSATNTAVSLVPAMTKYDVWGGDHQGNFVPDQNKLVLNADGSYSIVKTESGAQLDNANWWASGVTTGAYFANVDSKYWVLETDIVINAAGGWNQWHAGLMVDEKEFIMIMDRDWQLAAWTEWNLATSSNGGWTDLISDQKAALAGIVKDNNWGTSASPMKITAVRDDANIYVFLNGVYAGKYEVSSALFPNTSRGNSTKIGFMVKSGAEATFSNYWYELGEAKVDAYLASVSLEEPVVDVVKDVTTTEEVGATVEFYKQILVSTASGYVETTQWVEATEADFVKGAYIKMVVTPSAATATNSYIIESVKLNGGAITIGETGGEYLFVLKEAIDVDVEVAVKDLYTITVTQPSGATIVVKDAEGNPLEGDALTGIYYGTIVTVNVTNLAANTTIAADGLTATIGSTPSAINNGAQYKIVGDVTFAVELVTSTTVSGTINVDKYGAYADELTVSINDGAYEGTISEDEGVYTWSAYVPSTLTDFTVAVSSTTNRFRPIEIEVANVEATADEVKLVPALSETSVTGSAQSGWMDLGYDASTEAYSFTRSETSGTFTQNWDNCDWVNKYAAYTFNGINSTDWVIEATFTGLEYGIYEKTQAGFIVGDNALLILSERDNQLGAITCNNDWGGTGTRLISAERAATFGLLGETRGGDGHYTKWAHGEDTMKITAVRSGNDVYVFLNDQFICKQAVWAGLTDTASTKLGFVTCHGIQATFKDYWYTEDATEVSQFLAGKKCDAPTVDVIGGTYAIQKQQTDGTWVAASDADYYVGAYLKVVTTADATHSNAVVSSTGIDENGVFTLAADTSITITLEELVAYESVNVTIESAGLSMAGQEIKFVLGDQVKTATVDDAGTLTLADLAKNDVLTATTVLGGKEISLGTLTITNHTITWDVTAFGLSANGTANTATGTYVVKGSENGKVDFNFATPTAGNAWVATKVQISQEALDTLLANSNADTNEAVFGIEMRDTTGRQVENVIRIESGNIQLLSGDWSENLNGRADIEDLKTALTGDGLYLAMEYVASSGLTYTYIGTSMSTLNRIRDWGEGGANDPGWRSFAANSTIAGYSLGYVHNWKGDSAKCDVTFSDVFVSKSQDGVVNKNVLLDMSKATLKWQSTNNSFGGVNYQNAKGTLAYDAEDGYATYSFSSIATHATRPIGKSFVPYFQGFNFTDISAYSTISFKVKIDETTCQEGFSLTARTFNKSAAALQTIVAGEWVELTFNIADFTHCWDTTVSGYLAAVNTSALTNLGIVFMVSDTATMTMEAGFTMYVTDFVVA